MRANVKEFQCGQSTANFVHKL
ncbi:hypothetical protein [Trichormus azollae]